MEEQKLRIRRAFLHTLFGIAILLLIAYYPDTRWLLFYLLIAGIILSFLSTIMKIPVVNFFLENFELERHKKVFPGKSFLFFLAGSLLVIKLFSQDIALASIAILTFADPVSYFASNLNKAKYSKKPLNLIKNHYGTLLAILVAFVAAAFFIPIKYAILAAIFSMLAEAFIIRVWEDSIDDNFLIPLVAGTVIYLAMKVF